MNHSTIYHPHLPGSLRLTRRFFVAFLLVLLLFTVSLAPALSARAQAPAPTRSAASLDADISTDSAGRLNYRHQVVFENQRWNVALFRQVNAHHTPVLDVVMGFFDNLGIAYIKKHRIDIGIAWVFIPVFIYVLLRRRHLFGTLLLALAIETLCIVIVKQFVNQPRPGMILTGIHDLLGYRHSSFPSGHAAMMCVISLVMMYRECWWSRMLWLSPTLIIAYQRLYVGVHFPLDIFTGFLIGIMSALIAVQLMKGRIARACAERRESSPASLTG